MSTSTAPQPGKPRKSKPHDALFKAVFEQPEHAAALFREAFAPSISSAIAWDTLTPQPGSFVDPDLADHHSDLLFSVQLDGREAFVYVILEHQSTQHARMPLRMLNYAVQVWLRHCKQDEGPLPLLLTLVITHAPGGWTGPRSLFEMFDPDPSTIPDLARLLPNFSLTLLDLAHLGNEELKARALAAFPKLALWLLRDARDATTLFENLDFWAATFREALATPDGIEAVALLLRYIAHVCTSLHSEEFRENIRKQLPEAEQAAMTVAEQLHQEGRKEGREEGREEGLRMAVQKQLAFKFKALPNEYQTRLNAATVEQLDRYLERILTASTLEAVFSDS